MQIFPAKNCRKVFPRLDKSVPNGYLIPEISNKKERTIMKQFAFLLLGAALALNGSPLLDLSDAGIMPDTKVVLNFK